MPSVAAFHISFTPSWRMAILTVIVMGLFIRLGFWQWDRGREKRRLIASYHMQAQRAPLPFPGIQPKQFQRIVVQGRYLPATVLLDNQMHAHQFGYDVLVPFQLNDGTVVMIDRGWVEGDMRRISLPAIETPTQVQVIMGQVYFPSAKRWLLGPGLDVKHEKLAVIETLDIAMMSQFLHKSLYPFIIRQSAQDAKGYLREWAVVSSAPERHDAYALQWFMFAFVVGVIFVALHLKIQKK